MNCLLCHNGRGHLDSLSLWGSQTTRQAAWGFASFLSHTDSNKIPVMGMPVGNPYYWSVQDNTRYKTDYALNTTTGNRPRACHRFGHPHVAGLSFRRLDAHFRENYRVALGRIITSDFQFARASVNYLWEQFFGIGW